MRADPPLDALHGALGQWLPGHQLESAAPLGRGHIHDTWNVRSRAADGATAHCVVQRINTHVFADPEALARNLECVTAHVRAAQRTRGVPDPERRSLALLHSASGTSLHRDPSGSVWRGFPFVERTRSIDVPNSLAQAEAAARAFGAFLADLADLAPDRLEPTLPGFHDLTARRAALEDAVHEDPAGRMRGVAAEIEAARRLAAELARIPELASDALPVRVVHNDCKLNNLLFDEATGEPLCVVDLDTVMAGSAIFDFGELARTGACRAAEDETDLERVRVDAACFRALARGFVLGARGLLDPAEIRALPYAGARMALENGVRFLTDHLDGDRYFRVARPAHNRDRARAQLTLADQMLRARSALVAAVEELP